MIMKGIEKVETTPHIDRKKLAEENHNLIYWFCNKNHLHLEEWYDIIAIAYMKGINTYDENCGVKLSTYLTKIMKNGYLIELRNKQTKKQIPQSEISSLDFEYYNESDKGKHTLSDFIENENSFFENDICFKADLQKAFSELKIPKRNYQIFLLRAQGCTLEEVAIDFGVTRERVRVICKEIGEKLKAKLQKNGVDYFEK